MAFFQQAWYGIKKELSVYKNNPMILVYKASSVIIFSALTLALTPSSDNFQSIIVTNALFQLQLYFTPARMILHKVATEREDNFKEYLMVNGMTKAAYQAKISTSNYIEMIFFALAESISIFLSYRTHLENDHLALPKLFIILYVAGIAVVNLALLIATKLSPKNAPTIGSALILLLGLAYFAAVASESLVVYIFVSFHPCAGLALAISALLPTADTGYIWNGYSSMMGVGIMFATAILYLALYLHAERDQDVDSKRNKKAKQVTTSSILSQPLITNGNDAEAVDLESPARRDSSSAIHHEMNQNFISTTKTIEALNLKKIYPECTAVDGISFSVYEKEIFCLLGHNGAGKSTLVNMLTGLIPVSQGSFFYNGVEIGGDLDKIRGSIGLCPQKDFLLIENTVYQNLSFFAEIKKIPAEQFKAEIERVISKLGLDPFRDVAAKKLSGGFKRKLNIAIALLNDPKIIIMDEPTSGMDPVSRRNFWEIIKKLKQENKTIVLTTQFLDEAEELADRIAIMSKGKLFALGGSEFIKKKFGTGYNLILHDSENSAEIQNRALEIADKVHSFIPSASRDYNVAANIIQFTLPFSEQPKFADLFEALETIPGLAINLQMISLEEAFVNLGLNPEKMFEGEQPDEAQPKELDSPSPQLKNENLPQSFSREKSPSFKEQFDAILLERSYKCKTVRYLFFISYPLLFIIGGVAIGITLGDRQSGFQMMVSLFLTGNAFLMNSFVVPLVGERIAKIIHILKASGLRTFPYWVGNLAVDMFVKILMCVIIIITIFICNVDYLKDNIFNFILLYISFSFNMLSLGYNLSLSFDNLTITLASGPSIMLGGTLVPNLLYKLVLLLFGVNIKMYCFILSFFFCGPATLFQLGLNSLVPADLADDDYTQYAPMKPTWCYVLALLVFGALYFWRLVRKDSQVFEFKQKKIFDEKEETTIDLDYIEEEDIENEKQRLKSEENQDLIKAVEVQKVYPNGYKALHDLSFGVEKGQIFCLLGPNGAGKTTAFEIITATIPKTTGTIQLDGQNLVGEIPQIFYESGICSQSNTIWDYITVEQHLRVAAKVKGMTEEETQEAIDYLLRILKLEEYRHRGADKLSGGNKRKLCVAMSMIGAPKLLFLDEPSTGMDPVARKYLWDLIRQVMKQRQGAMVLTTHYMQEAELVGDKLGILINGRFATIGTMTELKRKFGEYSIVIYEDEQKNSKAELDELVKSVIPEAKRHSSLESKGITYKVNSNSMKFAKIFYQLERAKLDGKIKDFSIYTTTLEQIFIKLAKHQRRLTES